MRGLDEKRAIVRQLKEQLLVLEGFTTGADGRKIDFGLGPMDAAFPGGTFPIGAVHEFISPTEGCAAAANGFISGLLSTLHKEGGTCLWISVGRRLFPPSLKFFGVEPHRVIFVDLRLKKDILWVMEQGLKCSALAAVVAELADVSFAESRRLQLAVEKSRVTGFLHRYRPGTESPLACVSRWKIRPLASQPEDKLPGVGFPRWEVELVKIRNGRPGVWQLEWQHGGFRHLPGRKQAVPEQGMLKKKYYA